MGKPTAAKGKGQSYRDDPDAVSLHTTPDTYIYTDPDPDDGDDSSSNNGDDAALPSYTDSETAASTTTTTDLTIPSTPPPQDEYTPLHPPTTPSWRRQECETTSINIQETTIRIDPRLQDPQALQSYITNYLAIVPPRPGIRITGWHMQKVERDKKIQTEKTVDFDMLFTLNNYMPASGGSRSDGTPSWQPSVATPSRSCHRGSWRKTRAKGYKQDVELGDTAAFSLREWCEDFCANTANLKIFRVERVLVGLDEEVLRQRLTQSVRATGYRGHVDVAFPTSERFVDVYSPHWINRWRVTGWVRWVFYLTFLWIFTWPVLFLATRRWGVYEVLWRWSWVVKEGGERGGVRKVYAGISEQSWVDKYEGLVQGLVVEGFQGDASDLPVRVGGAGRARRRRVPERLPSTGHGGVDAAVGFLQGGVRAWGALTRGEAERGGAGQGEGEVEWWGWDEC
ncbi:hypothetical protein B0A50_02364 [Salinomyces thailandicus]|uniref:Uncharacterized protein n=1 Tax=Salinomyces thailandicus TaxID=706561 RepID=A0A4U0U6N8_9PEZI|nr:hypothetical protein B0A50_02364 [Salinomyces thailandica]